MKRRRRNNDNENGNTQQQQQQNLEQLSQTPIVFPFTWLGFVSIVEISEKKF